MNRMVELLVDGALKLSAWVCRRKGRHYPVILTPTITVCPNCGIYEPVG